MVPIVPPLGGPARPRDRHTGPGGASRAVLRRRMVRRFDPAVPVARRWSRDLVALAVRAPSAGFSQGWDFVALTDAGSARRSGRDRRRSATADAWRRGVSGAPALVVCLSNPAAYLDRYAEPDKARANLSSDPWPVPYWDTDTAMAVMVLLLAAEDAGLGALFFGVPGERHAAVREAFDIPDDRRLVGVVALGTEAAPRVGVRPVPAPAERRRRPPRGAVRRVARGASGPWVRMVGTLPRRVRGPTHRSRAPPHGQAQHHPATRGDRRADRRHRRRGGDAQRLPRVLLQRHLLARPPRRARRAQAGPAADPLRDERARACDPTART